MKSKRGVVFLALLGVLFVFSCKDLLKKLDVQKVVVSPKCMEMEIGQNATFTAQAYDSQDLLLTEATFDWSSNNTSSSKSTGAGVFQALAGGNSIVKANCQDVTDTGVLFVNPVRSVHNCRTYEWYQTQMGTGYAQNNNCGPTSTHMAIKWFRNGSGTVPTVNEIRDRHPRDGGWWYTDDVFESLTYYNVDFALIFCRGEGDLLACLQRGHPALLCVEMRWVNYNRHSIYDRFYTFDSGHFLVVKGYSENGDYFIVYDPNTWTNDYYPDTTAMGRNRYYRRSELINAVVNWWGFAFEIGAPASASSVEVASVPVARAGPRYLR